MAFTALAVAVAVPFTRAVIAADFADALSSPAIHSEKGVTFLQTPQERQGPAAAAQATGPGSMVTAGAQGLRQSPFN